MSGALTRSGALAMAAVCATMAASTLFAASPAHAQDAALALSDVFAHEPTLAQVQSMVAEAVPRPVVDAQRMRRSAWLPERVAVDVSGDLDGARRDENVVDQDFDELLAPDSTGTRLLQRDDNTRSVGLGVRIEWNLTRLAWDADELRVADAVVEAERSAAERSIDVAALWAERRQAQIELLLVPVEQIAERSDLMIEVERLTGEIDAMTGGRFREALGGAASR